MKPGLAQADGFVSRQAQGMLRVLGHLPGAPAIAILLSGLAICLIRKLAWQQPFLSAGWATVRNPRRILSAACARK